MEYLKWFVNVAFYYEKDKASGKPYWQDPAFVGLVVSIASVEALKYLGANIDSGLQLKIVGVITGIGAILSPQTGIVEKKPEPKPWHAQGEPADASRDQHNLSSLS
ncbi:MAG: hypothetical protein ABSF52_09395 [Syntrophobacteraceae bacterium]